MPKVVRFLRFTRRSLVPAAALLLLSLVSAADLAAQAQATTGIIRGIVRDPAGAGVGGAAVILEQRETGFRAEVATTSTGAFIRTLLPLGTYDVTAQALGQYGDERIEGLVLRVGETVNLVLDFKPVALAGITVTGDRPLVDTQDATQAQRLTGEAIDALPSNGRNFLDYALLTPGVQIGQGPDGEVLNISGQRGINNNVMVDGADFNNPFFGEQRGGQRPAFTFNQDAIQEFVVVGQGAPAEFGRSSGGFVTVITKSGTNEFEGSAHYFGQFDGIVSEFPSDRGGGKPELTRHQFGLTLGGPIVRDKVFFFISYDHQEAEETKQFTRQGFDQAELTKLENFLTSEWPGLFDNEFGPIARTDDNRALIAKLDVNLSENHRASLKYNYTWSEQLNGTFDVDAWGASANGLEKDFSHAINGALNSQLSNTLSNEFRFQWAREDRPRANVGPTFPGGDIPAQPAYDGVKPFPDTGMGFADGFRIGQPFFLPIDPGFDTRLQLVDNITKLSGDHLFKFGVEYNKTKVEQQFVGFSNARYLFDSVDSFIDFVQNDNSDGVVLFLQSATVDPFGQEELGLQDFTVKEVGVFLQDTWTPSPNLTLNLGVRWEGTYHPDMFIAPEDTYYGEYIADSAFDFPSDGTIPNDLNNWQPRFGLAYDLNGDGETVLRFNAGSYFSRIPMLVFAQHRTTNGAFQQILAGSGANYDNFGTIPSYGDLLAPSGTPFLPDIQVASPDLQLPRTWSFSAGFEKKLSDNVAIEVSAQHALTDNLFRFTNANAPELGTPYAIGTHSGGGGIGALTVTESSARSRYTAGTVGFKGRNALDGILDFELNYTLAQDKSDDDNERDPFTIRIADHTMIDREYGFSDRDRRHSANGYFLFHLPNGVNVNNILRFASATPVSENCIAGGRAGSPADRICADGSVLERNTLRRDNGFFAWDLRISKEFEVGDGTTIEPILEVFNLTNADNFLDTSQGGLLFNFDGTIRSGLGDTRRAQVGMRVRF